MEVIEATPNQSLATEILCGLYEEATPSELSVPSRHNERICTFVKYDKWKDIVSYTYTEEETNGGYFLRSTPRESITMDNFDELTVSHNTPDNTYYHIKTGKMRPSKGTSTLSEWEAGNEKALKLKE